MKLKYLIILLALSCSLDSYTQNKVKFEMGKKYFNILGYSEAIPYFEDYLKKSSEDVEAIQMLSECYSAINDYENAEKWLKALVSNPKNTDNSVYLSLGQVQQCLAKYEDAAAAYSKYLEFKQNGLAVNQLKACKQLDLFADHKDYLLEKVSFNNTGHDYGAFIKGNKFYFTATDSDKDDIKVDMYLHENFMNINEVEFSEAEYTFSNAKPSTLGVNTKYHEGSIWITEDGKKIFFTRNDYQPNTKGRDLGYDNNRITNLKIYSGDFNDNVVSNIEELPFNSSEYSCGHPVFDEKNKSLIFVSDMPGGMGGTDLWYAKLEGNTFASPLNFGDIINTEGNEMFPFISEDRLLYFASNGLGGLGGLDIFMSRLNNLSPEKPKNMGAPINTSYDDFGLYNYKDSRVGFISSNRPNGVGKDDIYMIVDNHYDLEISVIDAITKLPIANAVIKGILDGKVFVNKQIDNIGKLLLDVKGTNTYFFEVDAPFYFNSSDSITIMPSKTRDKFKLIIPLQPLVAKIEVKDAKSRKPISGALVSINSKCDNSTDSITTNSLGSYIYDVKRSCDLSLLATANSYFPKSETYSLEDANDTAVIEILMDRIHSNQIVLKNIYYDYDQSYIREDAEPDLKNLLSFMNTNPKALVELSSHTDAR